MRRIPIYIASDGLSLSKLCEGEPYKAHRVFYIYFIQHSRRLVVKFLLKTTVVMKKKFL